MMDWAAEVITVESEEEEEEARGMNICVVNGWRSRTLTSKICWRLGVRSARGKQEKRLMDGLAGAPLGEGWEVDVTGAMSENLRAVPWFAETKPGGGGAGGVVVVGGSGEVRTVPKGAKAEGVSGTASMVTVDEGAIFEGS